MFQLLLVLAIAGASPTKADQPANPFEEGLLQAAALTRLNYPDEALDKLDTLRKSVPKEHFLPLLDVLEGKALVQKGDTGKAITLLSRHLKSSRGSVAAFATLHHARAKALEGAWQESLDSFQRLWDSPAGKLLAADFVLEALDSAIQAGSKKPIRKWLRRCSNASAVEKSRRLAAEATATDALGKKPKKPCVSLFLDYPCAPLPAACQGMIAADELKPATRYKRALTLFNCWAYEESAAEFEHFLKTDGFKKFITDSHYYLGEIHSRKLRDNRSKALAHYKYVFKHSKSRKAYSLYQMGRCLMNLEKYDEALRLYAQYVRAYPDGQFVERCRYYEGWLPYDHDRLADALPGFERFLSRYKKSSLRSYVLWFKAWSELRQGHLKSALKGLQILVGYGNNIVAGKAYYWRGKVLARQKKEARAEAEFSRLVDRYPLSYYGWLGWQQLGELKEQQPHPVLVRQLPKPLRPTPTDMLLLIPKKRRAGFREVSDAIFLGEIAFARKRFRKDESRYFRLAGNKNRGLARFVAWSLLEEPQKLREWGRKHLRHRGKMPTKRGHLAWMMEYPEAYRLLIEAEAGRNGLPPWFLYSIMRQESRYRRGVVSWADAMGLMQLVPSTGSKTAALLSLPFAREHLFVPETNIKLAAGYLGALNRDMKGQLTLVAASYNAGPLAVRSFLKSNSGNDFDFMIEEIAYNEARNYCRKVAGHVLNYLVLYSPKDIRADIVSRLFPEKLDYDVGETVLY